jgi:hypothetical protein
VQKRLREWIGTLADVATLAALGTGVVVAAVVGAYLTLERAGIGWAITAAIGAFLLVLAAIRFIWNWLNRRFDPIGEETYLRDRRIQINDLVTPADPVVRRRTFENCRIFGPGIVLFHGCQVINPRFDGTLDSTLIEVPDGTAVVGPILFDECVLRDCRFHGIGIIGVPDAIAAIRASAANPTGG